MKLAIIRHAHANASGASGDFSRELSNRGHQQAVQAANFLNSSEFIADYAVVSAAVRTSQTFADLGLDCPTEYSLAAYNANATTLARLVQEAPDDAQSIGLVAHNPGVTDLAIACGYDNVMTTASVVIVEWSGTAADFGDAQISVIDHFSPSE